MRPLPTGLACALLLVATPALASGESAGFEPPIRLQVFDTAGGPPQLAPESGANHIELLPWFGVRPAAIGLHHLGLFAEARCLTYRLRGTLYDLVGGASLFLADDLALTGSYRILGYDPDLQGIRVGGEIEGPYFGVVFRY